MFGSQVSRVRVFAASRQGFSFVQGFQTRGLRTRNIKEVVKPTVFPKKIDTFLEKMATFPTKNGRIRELELFIEEKPPGPRSKLIEGIVPHMFEFAKRHQGRKMLNTIFEVGRARDQDRVAKHFMENILEYSSHHTRAMFFEGFVSKATEDQISLFLNEVIEPSGKNKEKFDKVFEGAEESAVVCLATKRPFSFVIKTLAKNSTPGQRELLLRNLKSDETKLMNAPDGKDILNILNSKEEVGSSNSTDEQGRSETIGE